MACSQPEASTAAAVDHVSSVLAAAGRAPAELELAVRFECGPLDEVEGMYVTDQPMTVDVPWVDVSDVLEQLGDRAAVDDTPSHEGVTVVHDGFITSGDGWQVRWGPTSVPELHGGLGTRVTVVGGGEIDRDDLLRWEDERTFVVVAHCG